MGSAGTAQREEQEEDVVVLDCRNGYESDVGKFQGAVPLNTNTFRSPHPPQPSTLNPPTLNSHTLDPQSKRVPTPHSPLQHQPLGVRVCMHMCVRAFGAGTRGRH